jgi:uncharacterized protein
LEGLLRRYLQEGVIVAFSGGVDSAFLLWAAKEIYDVSGGRLLAVTAHSPSLPKWDLDDACRLADKFGVPHKIIESHETELPEYIRNDLLRCYYCRKEMFRLSLDVADMEGFAHIIYGHNASDKDDFRPGHKAALESNILSPLAEAHLTKEEIRHILRVNGIEIADKPSAPCLSSRIMTGIPITEKRLRDVEDLESIIRRAGVSVSRVRICADGGGDFLRIEAAAEEMLKILKIKEQLVSEGKKRGYHWVTLDLAGYKTGGGNRE